MVKVAQTLGVHDDGNSICSENLIHRPCFVDAHGVLHARTPAFIDLKPETRRHLRATLSEKVFEMIDGAGGEGNHGVESCAASCTVEATNTSGLLAGFFWRVNRCTKCFVPRDIRF